MARPTKFTPATRERLLAALRAGLTLESAAHAAGIGYRTLRDWLARAEWLEGQSSLSSHDRELVCFLADYRQTLAAVEKELVGIIKSAATSGTWQAAAWTLERRWPHRWGRRTQVEWTPTLREKVEQLAAEAGLDPAEVLAEAEGVLRQLLQ